MFNLTDKVLGFLTLLRHKVAHTEVGKNNCLGLQQIGLQIEVLKQTLVFLNGVEVACLPLHVYAVGQVRAEDLRLEANIVRRLQRQLHTLVIFLVPEDARLVDNDTSVPLPYSSRR